MPHDYINRVLRSSGISGGLPADASERLSRLEAQVQRLGKGVSAPIASGLQVATALINDAAVTTAKLANGAVTAAKIAALDAALVLNNNIALYVKEVGGTTRAIAYMSATDVVHLGATSQNLILESGGTSTLYHRAAAGATSTVWHAGNDGTGSGLDADTVDGVQASALYQSGGTDVAVADGGTGASTAAGARSNLGVPDNAVASTASGKKVVGGSTTAAPGAISTGLTTVTGFAANVRSTTLAYFVLVSSISGGDVTVNVRDHAGNVITDSMTIDWIAFGT